MRLATARQQVVGLVAELGEVCVEGQPDGPDGSVALLADDDLGAPVNLMVNRGRASSFTYVPHVVGLTLAEAQKRIEDKNLRVGVVTYKKDDAYLPETVLEQSDPPGAELDIHTEIDLVVSKTD